MVDLVSLISAGLAFFVVAASPGPANISNATIAMSHGRRVSLVYGIGLSCGLVPWGLLAASGMGAILQSSVYVLMVLKVLGGAYLLWLAYQSGRAAWRGEPDTVKLTHDQRWFWRGLLLNLSNPKTIIAWMAALSVGLDAQAGLWAIVAATAVCIAVGFLNNALYSLVFSLNGMMRTYQRCRRAIQGAVAVIFASTGFGLVRSAFAR